MSDFMKSFASKSGGASGNRRPPLQTNIAIQITGQDLSAPNGGVVHGIVRAPEWLAGDEVSVRLMNEQEGLETFRKKYTPAENRKFFDKSRPTIAKLMTGFKVGKNDIEPMQVGGYLMFFGATKDMAATKEGSPTVWKAQYPENYGNDSSRDVLHGLARVTVDHGGENRRPRSYLDILFPNQATEIKSIDDLRAFYDEHMEGQVNGVDTNAQSVFRLVTSDDQVKTLFSYSARNTLEIPAAVDGEPARRVSVSASAEQTWKEGVVEGKHGKGLLRVVAAALGGAGLTIDPAQTGMVEKLKADLAAGTIRIEGIPGRRIPVIGSSLDDVLDPDTRLAKQAQKCLVAVTGRDDKVPGFVKMTVGTMTSTPKGGGNLPDTTIVTKFAADEFAKARTVDYVATPNYSPRFTADRDAEANQAAEAAAAAGGQEHSPLEEPAMAGGDEPEAAAEQDRSGPGM